MSINEPTLWQEIVLAEKQRQAIIAATVVKTSGSVPRRAGAKMLVWADGSIKGSVGGGLFEALVIRDALDALRQGKCRTVGYSFNPEGTSPLAFGAVCGGKAEVFLEVLLPKERLLIVGGGHCGQALAKFASLLDFSLVIAEDRAEFANPSLYPFANVEQVLHLPPDYEGLPTPDAQTYVALVTKGFVTDEAALRRVLASPAPYIGMIGSVRKREVVYTNLRDSGFTPEELARVHAPIGIEIGAETPEEIAISILAEVIQVRAKQRSLSEASSSKTP